MSSHLLIKQTAREIAAEERASGRSWGAEDRAPRFAPSSDEDVPACGTVPFADGVTRWRNTLLREQHIPRLTTGYSRIDRATKGVQPGELLIILGRTASGKTMLVDEVTSAFARQRPASAFLIVNLEMPVEQLVARMMRKHFRRTEDAIEQDARADEPRPAGALLRRDNHDP